MEETMRRRRLPSAVLASVVFATALLAAGAGAGAAGQYAPGEGSRQSASVDFTSKRPASSSGLAIDIDYVNPNDPEAKPPAVREIFIRLAKGARVDTSVPPLCEAGDQELIAQGESACPAESKVGEGFLRIDTGFPGPLRMLKEDVTFLNAADEIIFLTQDRATGARLASHATVLRRRLRSTAPTLPGSPPDGAAIDVVRERLDAFSSDGRHYITTPRHCPAEGYWQHKARFTYADGVSQLVVSRSPCAEPRPR